MKRKGVNTIGDNRIKEMVITAIYGAVTFLGIQIFRIPMPSAIGTPFVHFGHIFVVLGVLMLGGKCGAVSGTLGLVIFDLLNGFIKDIPQVFIETIFKCLIIGIIMTWFKKKAEGDSRKEYKGAIICAAVYAVMNVVIEFAMGIVKVMIIGSGWKAAVIASATSIPATVINAVFMLTAVTILYFPVRSIFIKCMANN